MKTLLRIVLSVALALLPIEAWAASGATTVSVFDSGGTARTVNVYSSTGAITGNLSWMNTICDFTTLTQCATVDSSNNLHIDAPSGSALLNAITQPVPILPATTCSTNSYSNGVPSPMNANLNGNPCVELDVWGGTALGAPSNFGTSPGAVKVPGTNAYNFVNVGNAATAIHVCGSRAYIHVTTASDISIVPGVSLQNVYVCDYSISFAGAGSVYLESTTTTGTAKGSACSATLAQIDLNWTGVAGGGEKGSKAIYTGLNTGASNGLCANFTGASVSADVSVSYDQY
jgi:hypothetical protein